MKKNKENGNIVILIAIYFICFIFISTAYSFFSEKLEMRSTVGFSQNASKKYSYDYILQYSWQSNGYYYYQYTVLITYTGNDIVDSWQLNINLPMSTEIYDCYNGICEISNNVLRVTNAYWNGYMTHNSIVSPGFIIKTTIPNYELDIVSVNFYKDGNLLNSSTTGNNDISNGNDNSNNETADNLVTDITAKLEISSYWDKITQYNLTIINNSKVDLTNWELKYQVPEGTKITDIWGSEYVIKDDELTLYDVSWSQIITSGSQMSEIGFQIETISPAPATLKLLSFKGINGNYEDMEFKI